MSPMGDLRLRPEAPIMRRTSGNIPPKKASVRALSAPVTVALVAYGATEVPSHDLRMLGGVHELGTPLVGTSYNVQRPVQKGQHR